MAALTFTFMLLFVLDFEIEMEFYVQSFYFSTAATFGKKIKN
jgi:hypothetical protein